MGERSIYKSGNFIHTSQTANYDSIFELDYLFVNIYTGLHLQSVSWKGII